MGLKFKNIQFSEDLMKDFLISLGFHNVTLRSNSFRFGFNADSNPNSTALFLKDCKYRSWSRDNSTGDLVDLVVAKLKCSVKDAFKVIEDFTNTKIVTININNELSDIITRLECIGCEEVTYPTYNESVMEAYEDCFSQLFLSDGAGLVSQSIFGIRYDIGSERIVSPIRDDVGRIVGILGRYNQKGDLGKIPKYLPLIPYKKHLFLYGMFENREFIKDSIIIVESEKSVLQAFTLGYRNVLALGGNNLSTQQLELIDSLNPSEVILGLDEGLQDKHIQEVANKLKSLNPFVRREVGYINSNHVGLGKKNCIFDESKDKIKEILEGGIIWI